MNDRGKFLVIDVKIHSQISIVFSFGNLFNWKWIIWFTSKECFNGD